MQLGLVIYATQLDEVANFYSEVFDLLQTEGDDFYRVLSNGSTEIVVLEAAISNLVSSLEEKTSTWVKPTFFIDTPLEEINRRVVNNGGHMFPVKSWEFAGRQICDGCDCDGNVFQCRFLKIEE